MTIDKPTRLDKSTGLPEVPEGYFWRIKRWNYGHGPYSLRVELRRRLAFGLSVAVEDSLSRHTEEDILRSANQVLRLSAARIENRRTINERDKFVGDYPPKSLTQ